LSRSNAAQRRIGLTFEEYPVRASLSAGLPTTLFVLVIARLYAGSRAVTLKATRRIAAGAHAAIALGNNNLSIFDF
jgi:hypothetical protein